MIRKWLLAAALVIGLHHSGSAARIVIEPGDNGYVVGIFGKIDYGDDVAFRQIIDGHNRILVGLASPGGNLDAGLKIGRMIHSRGFSTAVIDDTTCASACGLIWLAGIQKGMGLRAHIGFHAAYVKTDENETVSSSGNARIGAYLDALGLSENTIMYLTSAPPDDMEWITPTKALGNGINVTVLSKLAVPAPAQLTPSPPVAVARIGPSYDCARADTAVARFICTDADLSRIDVEMVQPYYVLRHQIGPSGWRALLVEAVDFQTQTAATCGIVGEALPTDTLSLKPCLAAAYRRQRSVWLGRLAGQGVQETMRPLEQHIALQTRLQTLGYIPATDKIDGVYGTVTRVAIMAWQSSQGVPASGLLGDADAARLRQSTTPASPAVTAFMQQGLADRQAWETWFAATTGEYHQGAYFWTTQRSLPNPRQCTSLSGSAAAGCLAAKARLDPTDVRRKSDPVYRTGWNSYVASS